MGCFLVVRNEREFMRERLSWMLGLFLLAVITRLLLITMMYNPVWFSEMYQVAKNVVETGAFANPFGFQTGPTAHVTPVYVGILTCLIWLFGTNSYLPLKLFAIFVSSCTAGLLPLLAEKSGMSRGIGILAGLLFAILPPFAVQMTGVWEQPLTEVCIILLIIIACRAVDYHWRRPQDIFRYGMLAGFSILLSPTLLPMILLIPLEVFIGNRKAFSVVRLAQIGLIILVWLIPWTARNYMMLGQIVPLRSNLGLELWVGNHPDADGHHTNDFNPTFNRAERAEMQQIGEAKYYERKKHLAISWISENPGAFSRLSLSRFQYFWFPGPSMCLQSNPFIGKLISIFLATVSTLSFFSLIRKWIRKDPYAWMWTASLLGPSLIYIVTHVTFTRYRAPIHGISLILACDFAMAVVYQLRDRYFKSGLVAN